MNTRNMSDRHGISPALRWLVVFTVIAVVASAGRPLPVLGDGDCSEPNDSRQSACMIEPGVRSGQIDHDGDVDLYRFESLDFGAVARVAVDGAVTARVLGWGDRVLADTAASGDTFLDLTLPAPGAYYVTVAAAEGRSDARAYSMQLEVAYPGAPPAVQYRNLFQTPSDADWIEVTTGPWRYEVADGALRITPTSEMTTGGSARVPWPSPSADLTLTVDGVVDEGWTDDGNTGLLIAVRNTPRTSIQTGPADDYTVDVEAHGRTLLSLRQYSVSQWLLQPAVPPLRPLAPGETVRVTVRVQGDEIETFLNGVSVARARDATLGDGRFALGAYTNGPPARMSFDDLLVTAPTVGHVSGPLGPGIDRSPGAVLYSDDFEDPDGGRLRSRVFLNGQWETAFADGEFAIRMLDPSFPRLPTVPLPVVSSSASIQADVRVVGDVDGRYITMQCRDQATERSSEYRLAVDPFTGRFTVGWWDAGTEIPRVRWTGSDAIRTGNATNTLELGCTSTTIFARINGAEVARVSESAYPNGRFTIGGGVLTDRKPLPAEVRFDNIVVRQI